MTSLSSTSMLAYLMTAVVSGAGQTGTADAGKPQAAQSVSMRNQSTGSMESNFENTTLLAPGADPENRPFKPLFNHLLADQKQFWSSPADLRKPGALKLFLPFAGLVGGLVLSDRWFSKQVPDRPSQLKRSQRISDYAVFSLIGMAGGAYAFGHLRHEDHLSEAGWLGGEAALDSTLVVFAMKEATRRERPYQGNGNGNFFGGGDSFPSEHAAIAWSVASVLAHEYPGPLTQLAAYGLASAVTLTRVMGKQHFPSDVAIGSALGWYLGRQVYRAHHDFGLGGQAWGDLAESHVESHADRPRSVENMGSPEVPLDSWVYAALERLAGLGYVEGSYLGMRPWTRMECARLLQETGGRIRESGEPEEAGPAKMYAELASEFAPETARLDGAPNLGVSLDSVYLRVTGISGLALRDGYHFGQTVVNDYGRPYGQGFSSVSGISAHAVAGPLSFYLRGEYQHAPGAVSLDPLAQQAIANADSTLPVSGAAPQIDRFQVIEASAAVTFRNTRISFGKQSLWLGPSQAGPLLFSNNADSVMMLRFDSATPFEVPLLSRLLGPARTEFFIGQLWGHQFEFNPPTLLGPGNIRPQPFLHGTKVSFRPTANLEFGMDFTAQFGGPGLPVTWHNFARTFFVHKASLAGNPGKRLSAFDLNYRIPGLRSWVSVYCDSLVIDEYSPIGSSHPSINPGIYFPRLPKLPNLELRLEGVTTDLNIPNHFGAGSVYRDGRFRSGYTNGGNLLGNWVGRMGRGEQLWAKYSFTPRNTVQFGFRHNNVDKGFIGGGHFTDWSLATDLWLDHDLSLAAKIQYEPWQFPVLSPGPRSNVMTSVGLTFTPRWGRRLSTAMKSSDSY